VFCIHPTWVNSDNTLSVSLTVWLCHVISSQLCVTLHYWRLFFILTVTQVGDVKVQWLHHLLLKPTPVFTGDMPHASLLTWVQCLPSVHTSEDTIWSLVLQNMETVSMTSLCLSSSMFMSYVSNCSASVCRPLHQTVKHWTFYSGDIRSSSTLLLLCF